MLQFKFTLGIDGSYWCRASSDPHSTGMAQPYHMARLLKKRLTKPRPSPCTMAAPTCATGYASRSRSIHCRRKITAAATIVA